MNTSSKRWAVLGIVVLITMLGIGLSTVLSNNSHNSIQIPTYSNNSNTIVAIHTGMPSTVVAAHTNTPLTIEQQLQRIDQVLSETLSGSIAYNVPNTMKLNETVTIELLLNPSLTPKELATQVVESGQVVTSSIDITPRMKAVLKDQDGGLEVKSLEENPEQLVSGTDTTKWTWFVTAKKSGSHKLTLVIYRLINYDGKDYWREVESYKAYIEVKVTLGQRILMMDWKWVLGIVITLLLIPAFWRWVDSKNKQKAAEKEAQLRQTEELQLQIEQEKRKKKNNQPKRTGQKSK